MTVKDFIAYLQAFPPDSELLVPNDDGDYVIVEKIKGPSSARTADGRHVPNALIIQNDGISHWQGRPSQR